MVEDLSWEGVVDQPPQLAWVLLSLGALGYRLDPQLEFRWASLKVLQCLSVLIWVLR